MNNPRLFRFRLTTLILLVLLMAMLVPHAVFADAAPWEAPLRASLGKIEGSLTATLSVYPDAFSFGQTVPAYGFWIRHAERITFDGVKIAPAKPDARQEFVIGSDATEVIIDGKPVTGAASIASDRLLKTID